MTETLTNAEQALTHDADYVHDIEIATKAIERLLYERTHLLREEVQAAQERESELVELAKEVARWHPDCVMPESYSPSMYGLARATVALIQALGVDEHQLSREEDSTYED